MELTSLIIPKELEEVVSGLSPPRPFSSFGGCSHHLQHLEEERRNEVFSSPSNSELPITVFPCGNQPLPFAWKFTQMDEKQ